MEGRTDRRAVLRTGARLAYAAPLVAATLPFAARSVEGSIGRGWPANFQQILCGCHGPEWAFADIGGSCNESTWESVLAGGGCGTCGSCDPTYSPTCGPNAHLHVGVTTTHCFDPDAVNGFCPVAYRSQCLRLVISPPT